MFSDFINGILNEIEYHEPHNKKVKDLIMAKFDVLESKLDALKAKVDALSVPAPVDDTADVKALEDKVDAITADVDAKVPTSTSPVSTAPVVPDPNTPAVATLL